MNIMWSAILLATVALLHAPSPSLAKMGYVFTAPNTFGVGTTEAMSLVIYDVPAKGEVTVELLDSAENNTLSSTTKTIEQPSPSDGQPVALFLSVPNNNEETIGKLRITGSFETTPEAYTFNSSTTVSLQSNSDNIFVQTDKPIYRPGQKVLFRVLGTDPQLRPLGNKLRADIWIENDIGIRLAQWLDTSFEKTFVELEMQLSDEPTLGTWTIFVNGTNGVYKTETFQVSEYVLPKFEVKITPPPFALVSDKNITWKICGQYTYGKLVHGNITIKATYESYSWDRTNLPFPVSRHNGPIEGCYNFTVEQDDLGWMNSTYRYRNMNVYAEITEEGTEITRNDSSLLSLTTNPVSLSFKSQGFGNQYFKPGLPFHGELSVTNPDGTPRADELVQLCSVVTTEAQPSLERYRLEKILACRNLTSDAQGIVAFSVAPGPNATTRIKVQADAVNFPVYRNPAEPQSIIYYRPTTTLTLYQWYSPSSSFVQIEPVNQKVKCGEQKNLTVLMTGNADNVYKIYVQVVSRGQITLQTTITQAFKDIQKPLDLDQTYIRNEDDEQKSDVALGSFNFPLLATADMPPKARVLVYYLRDDGEIIADSRDVKIEPCLKNDVKLSFTSDKQYPGTNVGLQIKASPGSLCGVGVVDKSIELLASGKQLTLERVFQILEQYDTNSYYWYNNRRCGGGILRPVPYNPIVVQRRSVSGVVWKPNNDYSTKADAFTAFQNSRVVIMTDLTLETKPCEQYNRPYVTRRPTRPLPTHRNKIALSRPQVVNDVMEISKVGAAGPPGFSLQPEAINVGPLKPVKEVREDFRETWLWELVQTDEAGEALVKRQLPDTITEWRGNAVCINSKQGLGVSPVASVTAFQPFFVSFTLPYSVRRGETSPVIVSLFNYLKEALNIALELEESESDFELKSPSKVVKLCARGDKSVTETFLVKPKVLGDLNFTVKAYTISDSICENEVTANVSARDAAVNTLLVEPEGYPREETINAFFCPAKDGSLYSSEYELKLPENVVEGSARAEFSVSGDLLGSSLKNIDKLIAMPTGCGEQNMLNFVPDIYILEYLTNSKRLTDEIKEKLLGYLRKGYQRQLTYRRVDSSYSAFGQSDPAGSIWLTAFVVKAFARAKEFVYVDQADIKSSAFWIVNQQKEDGCFPEVGLIHHKAMQGGVDSAKGSAATLTSYITISLLEANSINETILNSSLSCLALETNPSTYTLALMTYATCLANSTDGVTNFEKLISKAVVKDGLMYWEDDISKSKSIQVEIASYAVLSMLQPCGGSNVTRALPLIRWIARQRNANGGFVSTQDTVMALQALAAYGSHISQDPVSLHVKVESENLKESFEVNESNKLLVQTVKIASLPTPLDVEGNGTGCGLIQANLKYNVKSADDQVAFTLDVSTTRGVDKSCKKAAFSACISYQDEGRSSNMAMLEVKFVSGYSVDQGSLPVLKDDKLLKLKRWDIGANSIAFYFTQFDAEKKCFTFTLNQDFEVLDTKPAIVTVYDYYKPEQKISSEYTIDSQCP